MVRPSQRPGPAGPTRKCKPTSPTRCTSPSGSSRLTYDDNGKLVYRAIQPAILPLASGRRTRRAAPLKSATREGRAAARTARAAGRVKIVSVSYLKLRSVTPLTAERYAAGLRRLEQFCRQQRMPMFTSEQRDEALEKLFDQMYFDGAQAHEARYILFGSAFMMNFSATPQTYPRAHRALRGWARAAPGGTHAAMPWEAALLLSQALVTDGVKVDALGPFAKQAAQALVVQFDTYLRPHYVLDITRADCLLPHGKATKIITVLIRRSDDIAEGCTQDVHLALRGIERRRPGKTGDFDTAVRIGEPASAAAGRALVAALFRSLVDNAPDDEAKLFGELTLPRYARALAWASRRCKLEHLHLVPRSARHGGASADAAGGHRSLAEIQQRGLWRHPKSVARYRKPGLYHAQQSRMTDRQRTRAAAAATGLLRLLK